MVSAQARVVASDPRAHTRAELIASLEEHAQELERLQEQSGPQWRHAPRLRPRAGDAA